jgi:hypothetical protein
LTSEGAKEHLEQDDAAEVHRCKHSRERTVDEGPVYEEINVVEAVTKDCYAYCNRQAHDTGNYQHGADPLQPHHPHRFRDYIGEDGACSQHRYGVGEPLYLLALHPHRAAQPYQQRGRCYEPEGVQDSFHRVHGVCCDLYAEGVVDEIESCSRLGPERYRNRTCHDHHTNKPPKGSPTR